ncbi:MAG: LysR family transcriptional regulator [Kangiella sp.]|jgi:DNA-binding transcriptional LysR family regulator|nr:LysR family transcriptional regulator [Kangiella sp.]
MASIGTLRQLQILLALREHGSVTAASEALYLTQPTVSMQLKNLTDKIGMPLYQQHGKKLQFTDAGLEVLKTAKDVVDCFDQLEMRLSALKGLEAGKLRIAVVSTAKYFIPHLLGEFCKLYPNVEVNFSVGNRQQIIDRMKDNQDDFYVFTYPPKEIDLVTIKFLDNPLVAIAHNQHPLTQKKRISLQQFFKLPFLLREQGSGTRYAIERFLEEKNLPLNTRMIIESNEAIRHSVMSDLGVSILSAYTLVYGEDAGLSVLPVTGLPIRSQWYLGYLENKQLSPIAQRFLEWVTTEGYKQLEKQSQKVLKHSR